jgi:hypothetical protein
MSLLFMMNLGFAWGASVAVGTAGAGRTVAQPKTMGGMKTRA